jgi:hypothetical protein
MPYVLTSAPFLTSAACLCIMSLHDIVENVVYTHTYIFGDLPFISLIKEHHLAKCQTYTYVHMCNAVYINGRINSQAYIHLVVVG